MGGQLSCINETEALEAVYIYPSVEELQVGSDSGFVCLWKYLAADKRWNVIVYLKTETWRTVWTYFIYMNCESVQIAGLRDADERRNDAPIDHLFGSRNLRETVKTPICNWFRFRFIYCWLLIYLRASHHCYFPPPLTSLWEVLVATIVFMFEHERRFLWCTM